MQYIDLTVYTIGNAETLEQIYQYLTMLIGTHFVETTIKITVVWGLLFAILVSVFQGRFHTWIYHFLASYFIFQIFFMPVVNLSFYDTTTGETTPSIQGVPFGVGFIASLASTFSYEITQKIDELFQVGGPVVGWTPETGGYMASNGNSDLGFLHTNYGGLFDYLKMGLEIDPKLVENRFAPVYEMDSYIQQCFIPYIASLDQSQVHTLLKNTNLFKYMGTIKDSFFMNYNGNAYLCNDFYNKILKPDWESFVQHVATDPETLGFSKYVAHEISASLSAMTNATLHFNQVVTQAGIINALKENYFESGLTQNMNNRLLASYVVGRAEEQTKLWGESMFLWSSKVVPTLQAFLEGFFVILFPFLIILIFLPLVSFGGVHAAVGYLKVVAWIYLITPVLAIINGMINLQAIHQTTLWLQSIHMSGLTLGDYGYLLSQGNLYPAVAGAAAMSAPLWAWMLLQGFETGVMGMADLVGSIGSQFIGQGVSAPVLTSNIARDTREIQAGIMSGQTPLEALSNAGTWMFEQNANLAGLYNDLGAYRTFSDMERQLGIEKTLEMTTMGIWGNTMLTDGYGDAVYHISDGKVNTALETGALSKPSHVVDMSFGRVLIYSTKKGKIVSADFKPILGTSMVQANLTSSFSQLSTVSKSWVKQHVWGNGETYQKAKTALIASQDQAITAYIKGTSVDLKAIIGKNASVAQSFSDAKSLVHSLMKDYGWSEAKATDFVSQFGADLYAGGGGGGGGAQNIFLNLLRAFGAQAGGGSSAKGSDAFDRTHSFNDAMRFAHNKDYKFIEEASTSYVLNDSAAFSRMKKEEGSKLLGVTRQDLRQYQENWQEQKSLTHSVGEAISQVRTELGGVNINNLQGFLRFEYGNDISAAQEISMMETILKKINENDKSFIEKFEKAYTAYTLDMNETKDMAPGIQQYISDARKDFAKTIENKIEYGHKEGITKFYDKGHTEVENKQNKDGDNPNQSLTSKADGIFNQVTTNQGNINHSITTNANSITPARAEDPGLVNKVEKDDTGNLPSSLSNYIKDHPLFGVSLGGFTVLAGVKTIAEAYFGHKAIKELQKKASKFEKEIKSGGEEIENAAKENGIKLEDAAKGAGKVVEEDILPNTGGGGATGIFETTGEALLEDGVSTILGVIFPNELSPNDQFKSSPKDDK